MNEWTRFIRQIDKKKSTYLTGCYGQWKQCVPSPQEIHWECTTNASIKKKDNK